MNENQTNNEMVAESTHNPAQETVKMSTSETLKAVRKSKGMSQVEVSKASKIAQPTISGLERGSVNLSQKHAEKLARVLGVSVETLMGEAARKAA